MEQNYEDKLLKDALHEASPPDIDKSWAKMEELLNNEGFVLSNGVSASRILLRQKIWLSSIALLLSSAILVGTLASTRTVETGAGEQVNSKENALLANTPKATTPKATTSINQEISGQNKPGENSFTMQPTSQKSDHTDTRLVQSGLSTERIALPEENIASVPNSTFSDEKLLNRIDKLPIILTGLKIPKVPPVIITDSFSGSYLPAATSRLIKSQYYGNRVGVKLGVNTGPGFNYAKIPAQTQVGFFITIGQNPVHSFQAEVLYNQLPVKPIRSVEVKPLPDGNRLTDSVTIRKLNFVSVPILLKWRLMNNWSVALGPQFSVLTGLTGDRKLTSSLSGEDVKESTYEALDSKYGMKSYNIGMLLDFEYTLQRLSFNTRWQYGFTNIAVDNNSLVSTFRNHANITFGVAYNLR